METQQLHRLFPALVITFYVHQIVEAYQGQGTAPEFAKGTDALVHIQVQLQPSRWPKQIA